jgi:hypothetical protein
MSEPVIPDETERLRIFLAAERETSAHLRADNIALLKALEAIVIGTWSESELKRARDLVEDGRDALDEAQTEDRKLRADKAELLDMLKKCGAVNDVHFFEEARALIAKHEHP